MKKRRAAPATEQQRESLAKVLNTFALLNVLFNQGAKKKRRAYLLRLKRELQVKYPDGVSVSDCFLYVFTLGILHGFHRLGSYEQIRLALGNFALELIDIIHPGLDVESVQRILIDELRVLYRVRIPERVWSWKTGLLLELETKDLEVSP